MTLFSLLLPGISFFPTCVHCVSLCTPGHVCLCLLQPLQVEMHLSNSPSLDDDQLCTTNRGKPISLSPVHLTERKWASFTVEMKHKHTEKTVHEVNRPSSINLFISNQQPHFGYFNCSFHYSVQLHLNMQIIFSCYCQLSRGRFKAGSSCTITFHFLVVKV